MRTENSLSGRLKEGKGIVVNKNKLSSRKVSVRDLPLLWLFNKEEKQPFFNGKAEDPRTLRAAKPSGMTALFYHGNNAFTLIELLVVVLIIGILAAVALPQYQKAVLKSRYMQLMTFGNAIEKAAEAYRLANGVYPASFDELAIDFPGEKSEHLPGKMTVMSYEGKTCQLVAGMNDRPDSIQCLFRTTDGSLAYLSEYSKRSCMASYEWTLGNKICQNVTGKTIHTGQWGSSGINLYNMYFFN